MGPFSIGMSLTDAASLLPGLEDACGHAFSNGDASFWIASWKNAGRLDEVTVYGYGGWNGPHTADGLGIGSTVDDVLLAHPDAVQSFENHDYLQSGRLFFGYDADTRIVDTLGVTTDVPPWEYCG